MRSQLRFSFLLFESCSLKRIYYFSPQLKWDIESVSFVAVQQCIPMAFCKRIIIIKLNSLHWRTFSVRVVELAVVRLNNEVHKLNELNCRKLNQFFFPFNQLAQFACDETRPNTLCLFDFPLCIDGVECVKRTVRKKWKASAHPHTFTIN